MLELKKKGDKHWVFYDAEIVNNQDKDNLYRYAGVDLLSSSTYSKLDFTHNITSKFDNNKEVTHEYRSLSSQTITQI